MCFYLYIIRDRFKHVYCTTYARNCTSLVQENKQRRMDTDEEKWDWSRRRRRLPTRTIRLCVCTTAVTTLHYTYILVQSEVNVVVVKVGSACLLLICSLQLFALFHYRRLFQRSEFSQLLLLTCYCFHEIIAVTFDDIATSSA